ncbi:MAG: membrane protein insertion efficiency factor YidD [Candidatus Cloacimonetes bacterium]|nr:membrane protein insertion efficiency factor YidD [Candidatus Cloacimonadota bacterium]
MNILNKCVIFLISSYRKLISPVLPPSCRFRPTCSEYSLQAFTKYGFIKALNLSVHRILRCHPFHPGGYDPLP